LRCWKSNGMGFKDGRLNVQNRVGGAKGSDLSVE
jgi:hypothetical protein